MKTKSKFTKEGKRHLKTVVFAEFIKNETFKGSQLYIDVCEYYNELIIKSTENLPSNLPIKGVYFHAERVSGKEPNLVRTVISPQLTRERDVRDLVKKDTLNGSFPNVRFRIVKTTPIEEHWRWL